MTAKPRRIVADTSAVSHMYREDPIGLQYADSLKDIEVAISFQTLAELWSGVRLANWGTRRSEEYRRFLARYRVVWPDEDLVNRYAQVFAQCRSVGWTIDAADAWIAATAIHLDCPLATTDSDFTRVPGLTVFGR